MDTLLGQGLGWTSFSNGVQEEGVKRDGGVSVWGCNQVVTKLPQGSTTR